MVYYISVNLQTHFGVELLESDDGMAANSQRTQILFLYAAISSTVTDVIIFQTNCSCPRHGACSGWQSIFD